MIGGKVIETILLAQKVYVKVADKPYGKLETCAIYVERNGDSESIKVGDSLWWQGRVAYWNPQNSERKKCGVDFDIEIPRIGYSGVSRPEVE